LEGRRGENGLSGDGERREDRSRSVAPRYRAFAKGDVLVVTRLDLAGGRRPSAPRGPIYDANAIAFAEDGAIIGAGSECRSAS